ncbi:MAG TPA: hypothetical protein DCQ92_17615 [Verrucomicrobia subdivision 3 bacterium]|nr:hypothetical protein [Limisphaerales bacterium]
MSKTAFSPRARWTNRCCSTFIATSAATLLPIGRDDFAQPKSKSASTRHQLSHQVPLLVRDDFADLNVRLAGKEMLLLETLAFAEGRLLFIHPFSDFNGRATRLLLAEILRRQELPPVELAPTNDTARRNYISALEAADRLDWTPLTKLWQERLETT